jgi:hypothetical protein
LDPIVAGWRAGFGVSIAARPWHRAGSGIESNSTTTSFFIPYRILKLL